MINKKIAMATSALALGIIVSGVQAQSGKEAPTIAAGYAPYPMAVTIGERATQSGKIKKAPAIQSTSPDSAYKQFCAGEGPETLDMTVVLRPMTAAEQELCKTNGVKDFAVFKTGQTAIVVTFPGNANDFKTLSKKDLFLAMAKEVPDPQGSEKLVPNPYKTWKEVNSALPDLKIQIWNSSPVFAYYPVVLNQIMLAGCKQVAGLKNLETADPKAFETACTTFRKDNAYNEYDDLNTVAQKMGGGMGIFTDEFATKFGFNKLPIDGVEPIPGSISHNVYSVISPLMLHVKKSHIGQVPGLKEYLLEATSEDAISSNGYLLQKGLVPLPLPERRKIQVAVQEMTR